VRAIGDRVRNRTRIYYGWPIVVVLGVTTIISYGTSQYLFGVLLVPLAGELHASRAAISGAYSLGLLASGLLGLPIGPLVDRHGGRVLMSVGSAVSGLTLIAMSQLHTTLQLYALWSLGLGLGMALTYYPVSFTVVNNWFLRRRPAALGVLTFLGGLASLVLVPASGVLVQNLGWRLAVVVLGAVQLLVACPLHALVLRRRPEDIGLARDGDPPGGPTSPSGRAEGYTAVAPTLRVPAFWTLSLAGALVVMGANVLFAHLVPYLMTRAVAPVAAATIAGLIGVSSPPSRLLLNLLSARWGQHYLLVAALALTAVGPLLVLVGSDPRLFAVAVVLFGAGYGAQAPLRAAEVADHFGRPVYGSVTALQGIPAALAGAAGPLAAGWLFDRFGDYRLVFTVTAAGFLVAAAAVLLTPVVRAGQASGPGGLAG
jgi:MFS family permease